MAITYCDIDDDLRAVYRDIEKYRGLEDISSTVWESDTGNIYKWDQSGHIAALFENGVQLDEVSAYGSMATGKWFYDSDKDILYVQASDDANPNTHTMQHGVDWDSFKTTQRNDAQEMLENMLNDVMVVPFQKIVSPDESYNSAPYDANIIRACALLTCANIVQALRPDDSMGELLYKKVNNPNPDVDEMPGIVQMIKDGEISLKTQRVAREAGSFNWWENASNSATAFWQVRGFYTGSEYRLLRVQIDTAGAPGTATYKFSKDGGSTFDDTLQETHESEGDDVWVEVYNGIEVRFVGTFSDGDYIDIEAIPASEKPDIQSVGNLKAVR